MTTDQHHEGKGKPRAKKAAQRRPASQSSASKSEKESDMTTTMSSPVSPGTTATGTGGDQKGFLDFLGGIIPDVVGTVETGLGIDPGVAGQAMSQVLSIFGIGGPGKAFTPALPKDQIVSQLQQVVNPHLSDPDFMAALAAWLRAAIEPAKAYQAGKDYQPDPTKSWFSDAVSSIGHALSSVNPVQVAQVGLQALPWVMSFLP